MVADGGVVPDGEAVDRPVAMSHGTEPERMGRHAGDAPKGGQERVSEAARNDRGSHRDIEPWYVGRAAFAE